MTLNRYIGIDYAPDVAPIYDDKAIHGIRHHFGRLSWTDKTCYEAYTDYVYLLRAACGLSCSLRQLDRYLWLSGQRRLWLSRGTRAGVSGEVQRLFRKGDPEGGDPEVQRLLQTLLGDVP